MYAPYHARHLASVVLLSLLVLSACQDGPTAETIIVRAIDAHGGAHADDVVIEYDFREHHYTFRLDGGRFQYERAREDSIGFIRDVLNNDGFYRLVDEERADLPADRDSAYAASVNSVAYFGLLPFKLTDEAVQARLLGSERIEGEPYHEVEVTFRQEGGGRDYQDRFVYWFHEEDHTMDYMAYDYVSDEGGTRFRKAVNPRRIGGILFQDYENYTSDVIDRPGEPIEKMDDAFQADSLELVSMIEKRNITVEPIED